MKLICDGHEYTVVGDGNLAVLNNYGSLVARVSKSPCGEYWSFQGYDLEGRATDDHMRQHENAVNDVERLAVEFAANLES